MDETTNTVAQSAAQAAATAQQAVTQTAAQAQQAAQDAALAAHEQLKTQTNTLLAWIEKFLPWGNLFRVIGSLVVIFLIWLVYKMVVRAIKRANASKPDNKQKAMILTKFCKYAFYIILVMYVLSCFGIKLTALLGAAGVIGLAVGFAAQTSVSNIISGLFVISEGTMKIGDVIDAAGVTGVVDSIDLLSVKVHTLDNQMVRIPNSAIINSNFQNNSFYTKRRLTFAACVSYDTDIDVALKTFAKAPAICPTVLKDPAPAVWVDGFGDSNIDMTIAVWCETKNVIATKNAMFAAIVKVMQDANIDMNYNSVQVSFREENEKNNSADSKKRTLPAARPAQKTPAKKAVKAAAKKNSGKN